ncbi:MAG: hypothetical protein WC548_01835 [Candidatus Pacearchaeota archaeon]
MLFKKKKGMVDVRDLQKRGIVRISKNDSVVPTNDDGFVDVRSNAIASKKTGQSKTDFFYGAKTLGEKKQFSTELEGYNKREVDEKITELDNKIYKLEQRIELLEKKTGVNQPSYPENNLIGW